MKDLWTTKRTTLTKDGGNDLPTHNAPSTTSEQNPMGLHNTPGLCLLLCIDEGTSRTILHQENLKRISQDCELFQYLREKYFNFKKTKRWYTIRSMSSVSLAQASHQQFKKVILSLIFSSFNSTLAT